MSAQPEQFHFPWAEPVLATAAVRLKGQMRRVFDCMADHEWRTLDELAKATGDAQASVSAALRSLRKQQFGSHTVDKRRRVPAGLDAGAAAVWEYRLA